MAFVVETGDGIEAANAYISVETFRAHHSDRGRITDQIVSLTVSAPGADFEVGDIVALVGGTGIPATASVTSVEDVTGAVTGLLMLYAGQYSELPPSPTTVTGGSGTGLEVAHTIAIGDIDAETAIVRATDYVDQRFGLVFRGRRSLDLQGLQWPRSDACGDDGRPMHGVPHALQKAVAEYAIRAHVLKELAPDAPRAAPAQDFSNPASVTTGAAQVSGVISRRAVGVGSIKQDITYMSQAEVQALLRDRNAMTGGMVSGIYIPEYPTADMWISGLIEQNQRRLVRG